MMVFRVFFGWNKICFLGEFMGLLLLLWGLWKGLEIFGDWGLWFIVWNNIGYNF